MAAPRHAAVRSMASETRNLARERRWGIGLGKKVEGLVRGKSCDDQVPSWILCLYASRNAHPGAKILGLFACQFLTFKDPILPGDDLQSRE